jgi:hypothetical protein
MTFCPPFKLVIKAKQKSFPRKNQSLLPAGFQKWLLILLLIRADRHVHHDLRPKHNKIARSQLPNSSLVLFLIPVSLFSRFLPAWGPASPPVSSLPVRNGPSGSEPEMWPVVFPRSCFRSSEQHPLFHQILEGSAFCKTPRGRYDVSLIGKG